LSSVDPAQRLTLPPPEYLLVGDADVWADRRRTIGLVKHLTRRHLAQRYRGSALGFFWSFLNPILMMCVYSFAFKFIMRSEIPDCPFSCYFLTGFLAWSFFSTAAMNAASSVADNGYLINKCYFPRLVLPLSAVFSNLVNYLSTLPILLIFATIMGKPPTWNLLMLPLGIALLLLLATAVGILISCVAPFFRDLLQVIEVIFMAWFFASPIFYPVSFVEKSFADIGFAKGFALYQLNPMVGAIRFMHHVFLGLPVSFTGIAVSFGFGLALLGLGLLAFSKMSAKFANVT
jgi:lipopolysaccharide transport system permease protein